MKIDPDVGLTATIIAGLNDQIADRASARERGAWRADWPLPATWLNQERWKDELPTDEASDAVSDRERVAAKAHRKLVHRSDGCPHDPSHKFEEDCLDHIARLLRTPGRHARL